jgi:uncharacterized repeat protein (TIGR02543 family)
MGTRQRKYKVLLVILALCVHLFQTSNISAEAPTSPIVLSNDMLRFGTGYENSINATGNLQQPFYRDDLGNWRKLTFSSYPLDFEIMEGGDGTNWWNRNGSSLYNPTLQNQTFDYSKYTQTATGGYGIIITSGTVSINGKVLQITHEYELPQDKFLIKITTTLKNLSESSMTNLRYWVGTRDDYIGNSDVNYKTKGNIIEGQFAAITTQTEKAKALKIYSNNEGVLFYTNSDQANTIVGSSYGWYNIQSTDPVNTPINVYGDNSYAFYVRFDDLAPQEESVLNWYYAAGSISNLEQIIKDVYDSVQLSGNITNDSMEFEINEERDATTYYVVLPCSETVPTQEQIMSGQKADGSDADIAGMVESFANEPQIVTISGLDPGTCYKLYIVMEYSEEEILIVDPIEFETTNRYTYSFDSDGGSEIEAITQDVGTSITAPSNPTKTGYTFLGWDQDIPEVMGYEDIVFTALWQINTYTVTFNCCGAETATSSEVVYNELVVEPQSPTLMGYTFDGWYKEVGLVNAWNFESETMPANNITLYAKWFANTNTAYIVEHYQQNILNDEYTLVDSETLQGTTASTVNSESQTFVGFDENVSHTDRVISGVVAADGSLVLKRFYDRKVYAVIFKDWDNSEIDLSTYRYGSTLDFPDDLVREGYTFNGWDNESDVVTSDLTLVAQYLFNPISEVLVSDESMDVVIDGLGDAIEFSDEERQEEARIRLDINIYGEENLPEDVDILNEYILNTLNISLPNTMMLDISLFKIVGQQHTQLTESLHAITISFVVPTQFQEEDFNLVHIHDGVAHLVEYEYDPETHIITFTTDKFSTFALVYNTQEQIPETSDSDFGQVMSLLLLLVGLISFLRQKQGANI